MARAPRSRRRVRVSTKQRAGFSWNTVGIGLLITAFAIGNLYLRTSAKRMLTQTHRMERRIQALIEENKNLQIQMIELSSAERIRKIAEERLGMVPIERAPHVVYYEERAQGNGRGDLLASNLVRKDLASLNPAVLLQEVGE